MYFGDAHVITELEPNFYAHESISLNPNKYLNSTFLNIVLSIISDDKYGHDRVIFYRKKKNMLDYVCKMMYDRRVESSLQNQSGKIILKTFIT